MQHVQNAIKRMTREIKDYIERNPNPPYFTEKFRNEESAKHYKEGRFSGLSEAMGIINFYESVFALNSAPSDWDQDKLRVIFEAIKKHGDNPEEYIDLSYSVSESKYNSWPEHIRNIFKSAKINKEPYNE